MTVICYSVLVNHGGLNEGSCIMVGHLNTWAPVGGCLGRIRRYSLAGGPMILGTTGFEVSQDPMPFTVCPVPSAGSSRCELSAASAAVPPSAITNQNPLETKAQLNTTFIGRCGRSVLSQKYKSNWVTTITYGVPPAPKTAFYDLGPPQRRKCILGYSPIPDVLARCLG